MKLAGTVRIFRLLPLLMVVTMFSACDETGDNGDTDGTDSVDVLVPTEEISRPSTLRPELLGVWKMVEMRLGNEPVDQQAVGDSYLEFLPGDRMSIFSPGVDPDTIDATQNGDMIEAPQGFDSPQRIDSLDENRLVLVDIIDGEEVTYIYERQTSQ